MSAYVDSSVALRWLLRQPDALPLPPPAERLVSSHLLRVEMHRVIDRSRVHGQLSDEQCALTLARIGEFCATVDLVSLTPPILERAGGHFPTAIGTLDALHLATALTLRDRGVTPLTLLTHDRQQSLAARSLGFPVEGAD